jgi:hypothetical protein
MESRTGSAPHETAPAAPTAPAAKPQAAPAAQPGKDIDELSLEELEAATAPDPASEPDPAPAPEAAPAVQGQAKPAPADPSQLDIF